jgi:LacI family transcriptional regulator
MAPIRRRRYRAKPGTPTLRDVAHSAGVSTASVSRALTRPELVSDASREGILNVAREMGYVPNAAARALSARVSKLVGVIVGTLGDPLAGLAVQGLASRLEQDGWAIMLATAGEGAQGSAPRIRELVAHGCDAIALFDVNATGGQTRLAPVSSVPCAWLDQAGPAGATQTSGFDRARALVLGARYLHELGHRHIGLFGLGRARVIAAVQDALENSGVVPVSTPIAADLQDGGAVRERLETLLGLPFPPTALLCGSDSLAGTVLRECALLGVPVPGQLSLVGFGDTDLARQTRPALTSIRVPAYEVGRAAAEFLIAAVVGQTTSTIERTVKLVVRESTGIAPA